MRFPLNDKTLKASSWHSYDVDDVIKEMRSMLGWRWAVHAFRALMFLIGLTTFNALVNYGDGQDLDSYNKLLVLWYMMAGCITLFVLMVSLLEWLTTFSRQYEPLNLTGLRYWAIATMCCLSTGWLISLTGEVISNGPAIVASIMSIFGFLVFGLGLSELEDRPKTGSALQSKKSWGGMMKSVKRDCK